MDKKNTFLGILFLGAALVLMVVNATRTPEPLPPPPEGSAREAGATPVGPPPPTTIGEATGIERPVETGATPAPEAAPAVASGLPGGIAPAPFSTLYAGVVELRPDEQLVTLSNEFIDVHFTPFGGAIAEVALKKYPATRESAAPYVLNQRRAAPALALLDFPGADRGTRYELVTQSPTSIVWRATIPGQLEVTRTYTIQRDDRDGEPYLIRHETTFRNLADRPLQTPALTFNLGSAEPTNGDYTALNVGACRGKDVEFRGTGEFTSGWFRNMTGRSFPEKSVVDLETTDVAWASVKNQFFTTILMPEKPSGRVAARRVALTSNPAGPVGITGSWIAEPLTLTDGQPADVRLEFYAGPKEYVRLNAFDREQYRLMEWGTFFGIFAALIFKLMNLLYGMLAGSDWAWGWAIISTTIIIRTLMWPITAQAARSAKRMSKIAGPMKEIQEKYKDNRAKQQEETIKLFREHKINPVGGCLPLLFQFPIFIGLFTMLRSASELRFAEFLWINDLSAADTIAHIPGLGLPINPMPLLMGLTMWIQMRMTPTPTTDNATAKMMKFMPIFITLMCYGFSSGLAVYWTASNCFSIFQQWVTNRRQDPVEQAPVVATGAVDRAKPVRDAKVTNVPKSKKKR